MITYLLKILILAVFSFIIIYFYYSNPAHIENFNGYMIYIILIGLFYGIYKIIQLEFSEKKASFSLFKIFSFFLYHLLILSILFFYYTGDNVASIGLGIALFFKILFLSLLPIIIIFISYSFGRKVTSYLSYVKKETSIYKFIISIGIGFFSFIFLLDVIGMLGFYNLYIVFTLLIGMLALSYKEFIYSVKSLLDYKINVDIQEGNYLKLFSSEFLFIVSTLVLSVSLISIVRPFPIGWDDLGVYMNYPHLMAEAGSIISLGGMYAWQTFTGIGYMFGNPTQAFFLNIVGGFLSFIILILITSDLLKTTSDSKIKTFLNIPLLVGTLFIVMPMIVFQQAKDMKVDAGLFFVSIIALYLLFKYYLKLKNKIYLEKIKGFIDNKILGRKFHKNNLLIILIIGILAGFAFSIKFTTLLLISSILGVIAFVRLGFLGFLGFLAIFFAIFTKAGLWSMMNVVVNPRGIEGFETISFIVLATIGIVLLVISFILNKGVVKKFFAEFLIFLLGAFLALSPWLAKNIVDSYPKISIGTIITGTSERFIADYTKIYSPEELKIKEEERVKTRGIEDSGTTSNEDFGRYFGYEEGINNYIKFPWNLTMQVNQGGEFTDIGFLFLALLPVLLLFLPFRNKYYPFLIVIILILELLIFINFSNKNIESNKISSFPESTTKSLFVGSTNIFLDKKGNKDIFDINLGSYISKEELFSLVTPEENINAIKQKVHNIFYNDIKQKVLTNDYSKQINIIQKPLLEKDYKLIKELIEINNSYVQFIPSITSIVKLEKAIEKLEIKTEEKEKLINLWKENRNINQFFTDYFSKFNLPFGYMIILLIFLLPVFALLRFVETKDNSEKEKITLFKLNLIFATFYVFLWTISAFGIVWYGIAMYFSFLLTIAIGIYYISSYKDENDEKIFFTKMFGSLIIALIILIYFINSVFPHSFNNLKNAHYKEYKIGEINTTNAPFLYNKENIKILFYTNIAKEKRSKFLKEYVSKDLSNIKELNEAIKNQDIYLVQNILNEINIQINSQKNNTKQNLILLNESKKSLNNIYKNISNPPEKYKNKVGIYRIGTFLKYHISENNKRLLDDGLIFNFNNYIYNPSEDKTVENFKKIGVGYLLADLNAATIDRDERRNLTKRYERLLSTFTSDKLELIETDSICLKVALEDFQKSDKLEKNKIKFIEIAGVNYESYTKDMVQINRGVKLKACHNRILELIDENKVNDKDYNYLLNFKNYIVNIENKDKSRFIEILRQNIKPGFKVLFEIK